MAFTTYAIYPFADVDDNAGTASAVNETVPDTETAAGSDAGSPAAPLAHNRPGACPVGPGPAALPFESV